MKYMILILLLLPIVIAQENIDISLIEYNPSNDYARIQITNNYPQDLHNLKYQIDSFSQKEIGSILKQGFATVLVVNIAPGMHKLTITSDETSITKEIAFGSSIQEAQTKYESELIEKRREVQKEKILQQELEKNKPLQEAKISYTKYIILSIIILALIIIAYFLFKKKNVVK